MTHDDSTPDNLDLSSIYRNCTINSHITRTYIHTGTVQYCIGHHFFFFRNGKWVDDIYYPHRMVDLLFAYRNDKIPIMLRLPFPFPFPFLFLFPSNTPVTGTVSYQNLPTYRTRAQYW